MCLKQEKVDKEGRRTGKLTQAFHSLHALHVRFDKDLPHGCVQYEVSVREKIQNIHIVSNGRSMFPPSESVLVCSSSQRPLFKSQQLLHPHRVWSLQGSARELESEKICQ